MFQIMVVKVGFLFNLKNYFVRWMASHRCKQLCDWVIQMSITQEWLISLWCVNCVFNWYEIPFLQTIQVYHKSFIYALQHFWLHRLSCCCLLRALLLSMTISSHTWHLHLLPYLARSAQAQGPFFLCTTTLVLDKYIISYMKFRFSDDFALKVVKKEYVYRS